MAAVLTMMMGVSTLTAQAAAIPPHTVLPDGTVIEEGIANVNPGEEIRNGIRLENGLEVTVHANNGTKYLIYNEKRDMWMIDVVKTQEQNEINRRLYQDIKETDWFYAYVKRLTDEGGINGYDDKTFRPSATMTNAEFIKTVAALVSDEPVDASDGGHWAEPYVKKAEALGLLDAGELTEDAYSAEVTRQAMAKVMARCMAKVYGEEAVADTAAYTQTITDWDNTCEKCKDDIAQAYAKGIITGYEDGSFGGAKTATRAEASTMMVRLIDDAYRMEWIDGIPFNKVTDKNEKGMTEGAAQKFVYRFLDTFKIYEENGKVAIKGDFPQLPEGYYWDFSLEMMDREYTYINPQDGGSTAFTNALGKEYVAHKVIPHEGAFTKQFAFAASDVEDIQIRVSVDSYDTQEDNITFSIYRRYSEDVDNKSENYFVGEGRYKLNEIPCVWGIFGW